MPPTPKGERDEVSLKKKRKKRKTKLQIILKINGN
jgi:hypothetical protein